MIEDMLKKYPDVLSINDVMDILHLGRNKVYELLKQGALKSIRVGRKYIIPKKSMVDFLSVI